ncbi:MAG: GNAT family N-acyltransferase [Pseudomonadota bacterium]
MSRLPAYVIGLDCDMVRFGRHRYTAEVAKTEVQFAQAWAFRARCFCVDHKVDGDDFDRKCKHVLITDTANDKLVGCFRILHLSGSGIAQSYSAQFYDLSALKNYKGGMLEMGRFCTDPACADPDVLRLAWAAITDFVDMHDVQLLFGCSSFKGTAVAGYTDTFALLKARHLAPSHWMPKIKSPRVHRFAQLAGDGKTDLKNGLKQIPPLLRSYLSMGGWVSDHAVVDDRMGTLHVFTGVEVAAIPPARKRLLRALSSA